MKSGCADWRDDEASELIGEDEWVLKWVNCVVVVVGETVKMRLDVNVLRIIVDVGEFEGIFKLCRLPGSGLERMEPRLRGKQDEKAFQKFIGRYVTWCHSSGE